MRGLRKIEVTTGVWWVEAPATGLRVLCGCPADVVKHLMKKGLIAPVEQNGVRFETGPNAILLSDVMVQNGTFANLGEFPVLQMLYRQGMIIPGHPGNTGQMPRLIGSAEQVRAQLHYIHRGNYGLISESEMAEAGACTSLARERMSLKLKFAFGEIRPPIGLLDVVSVDADPADLGGGVTVERIRLNVFRFRLGQDMVDVDLNLLPGEDYRCPYDLPFRDLPREHFAVIHSGEGDGWDIYRPSMGAVLMVHGRIYLVDAGPNILSSLDALGIGVNEIAGIFHTHSHDDHFAGLTTLIRADHRIRYFATPLVRASVARKMAALLNIEVSSFSHYFDCVDLAEDEWNEVEGLEVRPLFTPHPVENTAFLFRVMGPEGMRSYAHMADICRLEVLRGFVRDDPAKPGLSPDLYRRLADDLSIRVDVKKVDAGGGMIHGDPADFQNDPSGRVILAHSAQIQSVPFGSLDVLIHTEEDYPRRTARDLLRAHFPHMNQETLTRLVADNQVISYCPGEEVMAEGQSVVYIHLLLSGSVATRQVHGESRSVLSAGAMIGELSGLFGSTAGESCRAVGYVRTLAIPADEYGQVVRALGLSAEITRLVENRDFLQRTWLFGEVMSSRTLNQIARDLTFRHFAPGEAVDIGPEAVGLLIRGRIDRVLGDHTVENLGPGDFFGEELAIFWTPSMFRLKACDHAEVFLAPAGLLAEIPSIRWKLFEASGKRMSAIFESRHAGRALLRWHEEYRVNVLRLDIQHRRLFEQANAILDAADGKATNAEMVSLIESMGEYARYHFGDEEAMLLRHGFPEVEGHRARHDGLLHQLDALSHRVAERGVLSEDELLPFLQEWLISHIMNEDRRYTAFLNAHGVE